MATAYIGLGANLGNPQKQILQAIRRVRRIPGVKLAALSPFYHSAAQGCPGSQPDYCNAAAALRTTLPPRRLHRQLQKAERAVRLSAGGKPRRTCAPRFIDIDYLFHGNARLHGKHLTLPHPRLMKRGFVLRPLADITGGDFRGIRWRQQCINALRAIAAPVDNHLPVILALESGGDNFSAALTTTSGEVVMMTTGGRQKGESETALPLINALLRKCKMTLAHFDAFAFAAGPGRFSGLRLSCALCQSFGYVHNKPIVQVPTLAALAEHNYPAAEQPAKQQTITAIPAHRGHYYRANCYIDNASLWRGENGEKGRKGEKAGEDKQGGLWRIKNTAIIRADQNPAPMPKASNPNAAATARLAITMFANGETTTPTKCAPLYIRQKIAQTIKERTKHRRQV